MKLILLLGFIIPTRLLFAQNFTEASPVPPFYDIKSGSIAFSDVNNDGHEDVLMCGQGYNQRITTLFLNDGNGNFNETGATFFEDLEFSAVAFSDVNNDGNEDVLITGSGVNDIKFAKLYINDGAGNFSEMTNTPFEGVNRGGVDFSDVNGDGANDVLIIGENSSFVPISKLYVNDGLGNFSEVSNTPFVGVSEGSVNFSDINNDGNEDVLITGQTGADTPVSKLYLNDGTGNFDEIINTPIDDVFFSAVAFSDINNDGNNDVLITGWNSSPKRIAKLYTNDGMGNFSENTGTPFPGLAFGAVAFSDINNDGFEDVLITGSDSLAAPKTKLYKNDGTGNFSEITNAAFENVVLSSVAFSDVNNDGYKDVLVTGENNGFEAVAKLYINEGLVSSTNDLDFVLRLDLTIHPNPVKSNTIKINFDSPEGGFVDIRVYDLNGYLLMQRREFVEIGVQFISMDITSLPTGSYFVQVKNKERTGSAKLMVK